MVVQTRYGTKILTNKKIIFESDDDDDTTTITSSSSNSSSRDDEDYIVSSSSQSSSSSDEDCDSILEDDINIPKIPNIIKPLLKLKYKIFESEDFMKYLKDVDKLDPKIDYILNNSSIKDKYKIQICELYSILIGQDIFSMEWIDIRNILKHEIKRIERKTCIYNNISREDYEKKIIEFKAAKKSMIIPIKEQIILLDAPIEIKSILYDKYKDLQEYSHTDSEEYTKNQAWLLNALQIPYNRIKILNIDNICNFLNIVYEKLNQEFYGMQKVKEQILLYLNMKLTNPNAKGYNLALLGDKGVGKCFALNTKILMYDGNIKNVQDVKLYDKLIGPRNIEITVTQLITSMDVMYTIHQPWAESYKVCKGHLLTLRCIKNINKFYTYIYNVQSYKQGDIINIPVEIFYSYSQQLQNKFSAVQVSIEIKNGIDFEIPLYLLGMWYGGCDPNTVDFAIVKNDNIFNAFKIYTKKYNTIFSIIYTTENLMNITLESHGEHSFKNVLKKLNLWGRYTILQQFKYLSYRHKLEFIAGFIDVNGIVEYSHNTITCLAIGGDDNYIDDLIFLIRSTGLYSKKQGNSIKIFGTSELLLQIPSMIYNQPYNDHLFKIHNITVTREGIEQYYGFEVNENSNHLFLLQDCTVVHNCFAPNTMIRMFNGKTKPVQYIQPGDLLMGDDNNYRRVENITNGNEIMYDIIQEKGIMYTVNESHILSLCIKKYNIINENTIRIFSINSNNKIIYIDDEKINCKFENTIYYVDMTVLEYLNYSQNIKKYLLGYKKGFSIENARLSNTNMFLLGILYNNKKYIYIPNEYYNYINKISILNYYQIYKHETHYTIFERIVDHLDIDINIDQLLLTTKERQYYFLAGLIISSITIHNDNIFKIQQKCICESVYNIIGIQINNIYDLSKLFNNDIYDFPIWSHAIQVIKKDVGQYYGFTLSSSSPNRRFLLHDGTVVHNTHISRTLADILNFPFEQISIGNITNSEILTGHQSTYIGSKPGIIASTLMKMKYKNGIIFLDEFDKIQNVEVSNSMLHIVDSTQNVAFNDNYFGQELKIDLSHLWFIFAMNEMPMCGPLKDRLFIINVDGYQHKDKIEITKNYLLKRVCKNINIDENHIIMDKDVTSYFVHKISIGDNKSNSGVRYIEQALIDLINKIVFIVNTSSTFANLSFSVSQKLEYPVVITNDLIDKLVLKDSVSVPNMMYI